MSQAPSSLAIINCSQVITLDGPDRPRVGPEMSQLALVEDGAILVRAGRISAVGPRSRIEPLIDKKCQVLDAGGRVLLPGFVDAHTHPVFAGTRADEFELRAMGKSYQEIAQGGGGIRATVRRTRRASEEELVEAGTKYAGWFIRGGTTTVEAKSGYGLSTESEIKLLRVIRALNESGVLRYVPTFLGAHELPDEYQGKQREYIGLVRDEMLPLVARGGLAEYCDVFCEEKVFTTEQSREILEVARALGLGLRLHADQLSNSGGALLAAQLGARTADHLEFTDDNGITALVKSGVQPVLLPGAVYALGSDRYPRARQMMEAGLAVVLATDFNPGSSPTTSMLMILSMAVTKMKMSPAEAITAATINAAYSLDRGASLGSLEIGKEADFAIHDCSDYRELAYFFGLEHAFSVFRGGNLVFTRNGAFAGSLP